MPQKPPDPNAAIRDSIRAQMLIHAHRVRGHTEARLDPLSLRAEDPHPDLDPANYGFGEADLDRPIYLFYGLGLETATLNEILSIASAAYCGTIGVEFMHIQDPEPKNWIQERLERVKDRHDLTPKFRKLVLERLIAAESFERFLHKRFLGTKRFGLDGAESTIPALEQVLLTASRMGVEEIAIGMAHRGRLNVLANVMGKRLAAIFAEFSGMAANPEEAGGSGDVKYHMGTSSERRFEGRRLHLSLTANPSHLEAVDPVVLGKVRAKQNLRGDTDRTEVLPLLLHGDAAFAGQGLVPETLDLSELRGYQVGGTVHLVINNQIGFTTNPTHARSGPYCSEVAKIVQAPILHVNGDDPEAVVYAARLATEFRQTFHRDVVVDLFCYRRHGHNEADEPAFTQPRMYRKIAQHPTTAEIYANRLVDDLVVPQEEIEGLRSGWEARLEAEFRVAETFTPDRADWLEGAWSGLQKVQGYDARRGHTEVESDVLREVGAALCHVPDGFSLHTKLGRFLDARSKMFESGEGVDWSTAEALAFGTLLVEGHPVRLSGQDCNRGTFSQRHASFIDQETEERIVPLNHVRPHQERIEIIDSPLSELAVLGFDYGYSLADPGTLVLWEAQFGDFANGAQIIIDQFLTAAESKWLRMSGLVLLLPHGFEGQGPEHSSARLERFLQVCAEDNLQVVNCTTPANFFHVLRRQMHREFRKPLIVMTPKSLLRNKRCVSKLSDFGPDSSFHRVMHCDQIPSLPEDARQVVLCSGKVYYDLLAEREKRGVYDVHFLRLEQLYPFPADALAEFLEPYRHCHLVWCQEEPRNMGAWDFVDEFIEEVAEGLGFEHPELRYAGRMTAASPATGLARVHAKEQAALVADAFELGKPRVRRTAARRAITEPRKS
ncbi:MAG: 2-oxoglutarate dehydrogenase E1 component [Myxococcota bacterium]|nr:2-oxoglutarate dehydrogenase E1 component [Myxococcota bacterium]